jgi:putative spermidine/putrescine transport system ATP-binding protein
MVRRSEGGASLELTSVVKRYRETVAVDGVSLSINPGEFLTLLGPSGSGKTTVLNLIAGFVRATEGEIWMDEVPITKVAPYRRNIGMVFQHYALFPHMTAAENVAYPLKQRKVARADVRRRVADALELVELGDLGSRYPRELSGGQQQRVALARAIVFDPRVLLMDEPLGALDRKLRELLQRHIKRLHHELGITFVYVTHDQDEALVLSERVAVFHNGRIEQVGSPVELYENPATVFVAQFLGESNLFPGTLTTEGRSATVECDGVALRGAENGNIRAGQGAVLMVRPERLRLAVGTGRGGTESRDATENRLLGTVNDITYLGSSLRIEVQLDLGREVTVRRSADEVADLRKGDRVTVVWEAEDTILLQGDDRSVEQALEEATSSREEATS